MQKSDDQKKHLQILLKMQELELLHRVSYSF